MTIICRHALPSSLFQGLQQNITLTLKMRSEFHQFYQPMSLNASLLQILLHLLCMIQRMHKVLVLHDKIEGTLNVTLCMNDKKYFVDVFGQQIAKTLHRCLELNTAFST